MNTYGLDNSFSSLHPNTTDQDPDDSVSVIYYLYFSKFHMIRDTNCYSI